MLTMIIKMEPSVAHIRFNIMIIIKDREHTVVPSESGTFDVETFVSFTAERGLVTGKRYMSNNEWKYYDEQHILD